MKRSGKTNSYRQQRVAQLVNAALIEILQRGKMLDIRLLNCPITITRVLVTADLKIANCYFVPFNTNLQKTELIVALNSSKNVIRNFVTNKINLKYSPDILFHYDHGFDHVAQIESLLKEVIEK